jgi:hypothetical protein
MKHKLIVGPDDFRNGYSAHSDSLGADTSPYGYGDTPEAALDELLDLLDDLEEQTSLAAKAKAAALATTYTPGPWTIYPETDGQEIYAVDWVPGLPIRGLIVRQPANATNWPANARLIAAAPELLAALKPLADQAFKTLTGGHQDLIDNAYAAIAKAEGRE